MLDTTIVVSYLKDELNQQLRETLLSLPKHISIITFVETCRYFHLSGKARDWNDIRADLANMETLPVTKEIGEKAGELAVEKRLALADSIIYATAQVNDLEMWTRDKDFSGLKGVKLV